MKQSLPPFDSQITFIYTDSLQQTTEWYERLFGWELAVDQGRRRIYRVAGQSFVGICERSSVGINHDDVILTFVTDDVDGWYERLHSQGVITVARPEVTSSTASTTSSRATRTAIGLKSSVFCHPRRVPFVTNRRRSG